MSETIHFDMFGPTLIVIPIFVLGIAAFLYAGYQWALPRPIPGIPYNKEAAKRLLGDVPDMVAYNNKTNTFFPWLADQSRKLNSPIIQLFGRPFQKPWVVLYDFKESQDILMRRTKEFDRSNFLGDMFAGLLPDHHIRKRSSDEKFKSNRALLKDLMTPGFLNSVAAPQIYSALETMLKLWQTKLDLAKGHPFAADDDIYNGALDAIFAATFSLSPEDSTLYAERQFLLSSKLIEFPSDLDKPVKFPKAPHPPAFDAIFTLTESLETSMKSPLPRFHHWLLRQLPYMKSAHRAKENLIENELQKGIKRLESGEHSMHCALDDILRREMAIAKKEGRPPTYNTRPIMDELFGFLIAGHDTTSTTLCWGLKYLTDTPAVQTKFRSELRKAYTAAVAEQRNPTAEEITKTHVPYLDAVIEEVNRTAFTASGVMRVTLVDTTVLGHHIPKGTDVFCMQNGPGYWTQGYDIPDSLRNESALTSKGRQVGSWDPKDIQELKPERWLVKDEAGNSVFDAMVGPHLAFGLGPRGCFGKRLAYLELRLMLVMIIWNFEFKPCPKELSGYAATDKLTRKPHQVYAKLQKVKW